MTCGILNNGNSGENGGKRRKLANCYTVFMGKYEF